MLLSAVLTVCALTGSGHKTCDVRVLVVHDSPSLQICNEDTDEVAQQVAAQFRQANKGSVILVSNGLCMTIQEMKEVVNDAPRYMQEEGYTYTLKLY